jgi:hypothetical protein
MRHIIHRHKTVWKNKVFFLAAFDGFLFLAASLAINYAAGTYAAMQASNSVSDLFLDNLPTLNVGFIFIYGFVLFVLFVAALLIRDPRKIPFVLKSMALFIVIRAVFMTLTHIGPSPEQAFVETGNVIQKFTFGADLFFSGHTGLPFLMALIFWQSRRLRAVFLSTSVIFGASVLLGHLHYSIDVFAAYFITYSIFKMSQKAFIKDYKLSAENGASVD